ncbi:LamG domain-containing protein [Telluribacter sp.]|jgi:hypothetical protein|uniref:LamG domain-containing protein n=1 Tax=Telluribacter sp. TaxID=1978767 RepID=UPI002E0D1479|nr:LamG domain-containing protein [Telluribacter sp.]
MTFLFLSLLLTAISGFIQPGDETVPTADVIQQTPGLVAFWDFQEAAGQDRVSKHGQYRLQEKGGTVERVEDGVLGTYSARLVDEKYFLLSRKELRELNIHGKDAQVTVVAWVKRQHPKAWQAIAGVWDETRGKRQYCLFLNATSRTHNREMVRYPTQDRVHGHVSAIGGSTPGHCCCVTYSTGKTSIPLDSWQQIAMTYDGAYSRVYVNGVLDAEEDYNPFYYPEGLFDGGEDGAPFTVGAVSAHGKMNNFFVGLIGGLAVYNRALSAQELRAMK